MNTYSLKARAARTIAFAYFVSAFVFAYGVNKLATSDDAAIAGIIVLILACVMGLIGFTEIAERWEAQHAVKVRAARAQQWAEEVAEAQRVQQLRADAYYQFVGNWGMSDKLANQLVECDILTLADALEVERQHQLRGGSYCDELMDLFHAHEAAQFTNAFLNGDEQSDADLVAMEEVYLNRAADYPYCD